MLKTILKVAPLAILLSLGLGYYLITQSKEHLRPTIVACITMTLVLIPFFSLGRGASPYSLANYLGTNFRSITQTIIYFLLIHLFFSWGTSTFSFMATGKLALFLCIPAVLVTMSSPGRSVGIWDALAIVAIWLPFDAGWIVDIWTWPAGEGAYVLNAIVAVSFAVILFVGYRRLPNVGYFYRFNYSDIGLAFVFAAIFLPIALTFGLATDFIAYNGSTNVGKMLLASIGIFLFIGIPEELLFRGLFQNILQQRLKSPWLAIIIASICFGLTHYNNGEIQPDWRYILLATVAGLFYGKAYAKTRNLMAAAIIHTIVDAVWLTFFK